MNPIAQELNATIKKGNPHIYEMLSEVGKSLFFPKGILSQGAEAKEKAHRFNATIGMATEKGHTMYLPSVMAMLNDLTPEQALTYAPSFGILPLRRIWQQALLTKNPSLEGKPISLPVVTQALTHGLSLVADMWADPGDVIVLPDKLWGNYNLIFAVRRGVRIVRYPFFDSRKGFNLEGLRTCLQEQAGHCRKIIVILNFPNNPTGYTPTPAEAGSIAEILAEVARGGPLTLAVTDDAYFGLFYEDNALQESIFARLTGREPKLLALKLDGATKEDYVWGLRVGFLTYGACLEGEPRAVYEALEKKTAGAVRGSISNVSHLSQEMVLRTLRSEDYQAAKREKFQIMLARAREVKRVLADPKYQSAWEAYPFNSGYFMCLRLKRVEAEPLRVHLLEKYGAGVIALGRHDLRVAFSCLEKENIQEFFDIILQATDDLA